MNCPIFVAGQALLLYMTSNRGQNVHLVVSTFHLVASTCHLVVSTCRVVVSTRGAVASSSQLVWTNHLLAWACRLVVSSFQLAVSSCQLFISSRYSEKTLAQKTQTAQAQVPMCDSSTWYFNLAIHKLRKFRFCKAFFAIRFPCKHCNMLPFCLGLFREEIIE